MYKIFLKEVKLALQKVNVIRKAKGWAWRAGRSGLYRGHSTHSNHVESWSLIASWLKYTSWEGYLGAGVTEAWIPGGQQPARHADHRCPFMCLLQVEGTIHLPRPGAPERARGTKAESWRAGDSRWSWGSTPLSPIPLSPAPQPSPSYGRCGLVSGPLSPTQSPPGDGLVLGSVPPP